MKRYSKTKPVTDTGYKGHDLAVSLTELIFDVETVEFLGYIVGNSGVTISETNVDFILIWKAPQSVKDVQLCIGFANFY